MTSSTSVNSYPQDSTGRLGESCPETTQPPAAALRGVDPLKSALVYLLASLFCAFFGAVYEVFSHEVYAYFMIYAFALPLALGALPNMAIALSGKRAVDKRAANAWNSGVATLTVGCLFKGALDIYGTTSQFTIVYAVVAAILLVAGIVIGLRAQSAGSLRAGGASRKTMRPAVPGVPPAAPCVSSRRNAGGVL